MRDKIAREAIERLEQKIFELKDQLIDATTYWNTDNPPQFWPWPYPREKMHAPQILQRFGELYDHLGIERKIIPATSETPKLVKKETPTKTHKPSSPTAGGGSGGVQRK